MKYLGMFVVVVWLLAACNYQPIVAPDAGELEAQAGFVDVGGTLDVTITSRAGPSSLVLDNNGKPVVAWAECCQRIAVRVQTWNGSGWIEHATPLEDRCYCNDSLNSKSLAIDRSNNPVLATVGSIGEFNSLDVRRWNGSQWIFLSTQLSAGAISETRRSINVVRASVAIDAQNRPVVVVTSTEYQDEFTDPSTRDRILSVGRWNGTKIVELGKPVESYQDNPITGKSGTPFNVGSISLAVDNQDRPIVAVVRCLASDGDCKTGNLFVKRWDGSKWVQLGTSLSRSTSNNTYNPSLAVDKNGNLFVAYIENVSGDINLYVKKWTGSTWVQVGTSNVDSAGSGVDNPSLALTPDGRPMVAYDESYRGNRNIYIKRLNASNTWEYVGSRVERTIANNAYLPSLAVDAVGNAIFSYEEEVAGQQRNIYVRKYQP